MVISRLEEPQFDLNLNQQIWSVMRRATDMSLTSSLLQMQVLFFPAWTLSYLAHAAPVQDVVERGETFAGNFYPLYVSFHPARHRRKCVSILVVLARSLTGSRG